MDTETNQSLASQKTNAEPEEPIIKVQNLVLKFGDRAVLDNISFEVNRGQTVAIMGGSGCGKSTLLRCLIGDYKPDSGHIYLFGQDITTLSERELNKIRLKFGILFQSGALFNSMTVGENVALPLIEHSNLDSKIINIIVKLKLDLVGLKDYEHLKPEQLSGGMRKRVGLSRAIVLDPEILFYDEPTAGLDPIMAGVIDKLIKDLSLKLKVTSLVVTHDIESAFRISDRIMVLYDSKIVESGTVEQIKNSKNDVVRQFISGAPDGPIPWVQTSSSLME